MIEKGFMFISDFNWFMFNEHDNWFMFYISEVIDLCLT